MQFILSILVTLVLFGCSPMSIDPVAIDAELEQLLNHKDYFLLDEVLAAKKNMLAPERSLYFRVFIEKAFGKREESTILIDSLLRHFRQKIPDSVVVDLLDVKASNHIYTYQYKMASEIYQTILTEFPTLIDSANRANYENVHALVETISEVGAQMMHLGKDGTIPLQRNPFNHLLSPVTINNVSEDFIFDTGANFSTIALSQAKRMNLKLFDQSIEVGSSTKTTIQSTMAVADSLYFGDILYENVVFIVMPDEQLTFPEISYVIKGIIGFPVIHQLGEIHLYNNGTLKVPAVRTKKTFRNMALEGLNPVVRTYSKNDTLLFTFDTGASHSELSMNYFKAHKAEVQARGTRVTNQRGGAGGRSAVDEYLLLNFPLKVGSEEAVFDTIPVTLEDYSFNTYFDGNLGQDFTGRFKTVMLNFEDMFIDFE